MSSMARTFGAPDRVPAGNVAVRTSTGSASGRSLPVTVDTMCRTWLNRSICMNSTTSTLPGSQTRPRSLRARSTSMRCSARSLGSASSSSARAASTATSPDRGRVPAMGWAMTVPSSTVTSASGEEPTTWNRRPSGAWSRTRYM